MPVNDLQLSSQKNDLQVNEQKLHGLDVQQAELLIDFFPWIICLN
jgi:hypothetical protein